MPPRSFDISLVYLLSSLLSPLSSPLSVYTRTIVGRAMSQHYTPVDARGSLPFTSSITLGKIGRRGEGGEGMEGSHTAVPVP